MSSHRPHRAALGIDVALAEIQRGAGRQYDAKVAEACVKVFEAGFKFAYFQFDGIGTQRRAPANGAPVRGAD
jgi:response regulator RpfG family c-di-GMP phosphodiesterase